MIVGQQTSQNRDWRERGFTYALVALAALGCQASVQGQVSTAHSQAKQSDAYPDSDNSEPPDGDQAALVGLNVAQTSATATPALLGARHDLALATGAVPTCSCMSFAVGDSTDERFVWEGQRPALVRDESVVVAFSMVDGECPPDKVASYRGYQLVGDDVHVLIEQAVEGRPHLVGAIVPRPQPGGSFVVIPPADAPFGHSRKPTETKCILGEGASAALSATEANAALASNANLAPNTGPQVGSAVTEQGAFKQAQLHATDDEEVPTPEEFSATPTDIPLDDGPHSPRDGFHFAMLLGPEYLMADVNAGNGLSPHPASGLGLGFDLFIGGNVSRGAAVGIALGGSSAPDPDLEVDDDRQAEAVSELRGWALEGSTLTLSGVQMNLFRIGAFVDYYFSTRSNWHALLMLGYANLSFSGGEVAESMQGFAAHGGLGYDVWLSRQWSVGMLARLFWSPMSSSENNSTVHVLAPSLTLSVAFH